MKYVLIKNNKVIKLTNKITEQDLDKYKPDFVAKGDKEYSIEINGSIVTIEYCNLLDMNTHFIITNISNEYIGDILHSFYGNSFKSLDDINNEIISCY